CPAPQVACAQALNGGKPEVEAQSFERLNFYMETLAVPQRRNMDDPRVIEGKKIFTRIGCNQCHKESWEIEPGWVIYPYTDMLLHDMGEGLADKTIDKTKVRAKWRTPPLWGVGLIPV